MPRRYLQSAVKFRADGPSFAAEAVSAAKFSCKGPRFTEEALSAAKFRALFIVEAVSATKYSGEVPQFMALKWSYKGLLFRFAVE